MYSEQYTQSEEGVSTNTVKCYVLIIHSDMYL